MEETKRTSKVERKIIRKRREDEWMSWRTAEAVCPHFPSYLHRKDGGARGREGGRAASYLIGVEGRLERLTVLANTQKGKRRRSCLVIVFACCWWLLLSAEREE